ncbi:hypothetical protein EV421DRAFT_2035632 [Armillaria borealis]|uniref:Uncharacterized protein n=1 Tax=Armillaria borealis TaxID=47425 RepID=A0AA39JHI9_9AGAR|nr:hypothetical protein EV421DRAFT_2035632 [Armillaria borealis]
MDNEPSTEPPPGFMPYPSVVVSGPDESPETPKMILQLALRKLQALVRLGCLPLAPHTNLCLLLLDSHTPFLQAGCPQIRLTPTLFPRRAANGAAHPPPRLLPLRHPLEAGRIEAVKARAVHLYRALRLSLVGGAVMSPGASPPDPTMYMNTLANSATATPRMGMGMVCPRRWLEDSLHIWARCLFIARKFVAEVQFSSGPIYLALNVNVNVFGLGEREREFKYVRRAFRNFWESLNLELNGVYIS